MDVLRLLLPALLVFPDPSAFQTLENNTLPYTRECDYVFMRAKLSRVRTSWRIKSSLRTNTTLAWPII